MLRQISRKLFGLVLFLVIASCAGGGGCGGCAEPLPGGFPRASAIDNAASVRVTRSGLDFLAKNLPTIISKVLSTNNGVMTISVPKTDFSGSVDLVITSFDYTVHICPRGPNTTGNPPTCEVDVQVGNAQLHLDAIKPDVIKITGTLPVRLMDLPINVENSGPDMGDFDVGLGSGQCNGSTPQFDYKAFPIEVDIPLVNETTDPRNGYTMIDINNAVINPQVTKDDVAICKDCGFVTGVCDAIFGYIKDKVFNSLVGGIKDKLKGVLADQLCTKPDATLNPPCPNGTQENANKSQCVFNTKPDTCVPVALGTEGHLNLSGALTSISPGTTGGFDFVLASGGNMDPAPDADADNIGYPGHAPNGMTLTMLGGALPSPQSTCVPLFKNDPPTNIPIPDEMKLDKQSPWPQDDPTGPHVGIALAGRFLNYAFGSVYNSGLLCLGVTTENFQQLQTGLLSALVNSLPDFTFEHKPGAVAITTRPQVPPTVKLGGGTDIKSDPLLTISLKQFAVDFYVFSDDRYIRVFTFTGDLTIPVNLTTGKDPKKNPKGGLLPTIGDMTVENPTLSNSDLLMDDPSTVATSLGGILGSISSQLTGAIGAVDLSGLLKTYGLGLTVPDGGIRKLTKGNDDFLAIFADLSTSTAATVEADTTARITEKVVHPEAMGLTNARRDLFPELHAVFGSPLDDGTRAVEYSWKIDQGARSAWTRDKNVVIKQDDLFLQGKHTLSVVARVVGQPDTEDLTPAEVPFTIDVLPPEVKVTEDEHAAGVVHVAAWDLVSDDASLRGRFKAGDGAFGDWKPLAELASVDLGGASTFTVDVKDEEGNTRTITQPLVRGRPDQSLKAAGGCNCAVVGGGAGATGDGFPSGLGLAAGVGLLALVAMRRRQRFGVASALGARAAAIGVGAIATIAAGTQGCSCGSDNGDSATTQGCGTDCKQACGEALQPGIVGAYTSVAKAKDGTVWVAGYDDAYIPPADKPVIFGDLVVGKYDATKQQVGWQTVDGVFARTDGSCPSNDRTGWRGGESEGGDDVGLWTSIQLDPNDHPMVSYYDATNHQLKFAFTDDGTTWQNYVVRSDPTADIGRYAKMIVVGANPVIAFSQNEPGNDGYVRSKVVLAKATSASPRQPSDWTFEDVASDEKAPCRASTCTGSDVCVKSTGQCTTTVGGCTPDDCGGSPNACVTVDGKATCVETLTSTFIEAYPASLGDYIAVANGPQGLGIVSYDRNHGNLVAYTNVAGSWQQKILDGETGDRAANTAVDTGDVGIGASLAITSNGDWHVTYVNGFTEALQYLLVPGGTTPGKAEIVDDGSTEATGGAPFVDGKHLVGDDSNLKVGDDGSVTVLYQDATMGELKVAVGAPGAAGGSHTWSVKSVAQTGRFAGFFPQYVPNENSLTNFWRATDRTQLTMNGDVAFVSAP